MYKCAHIRTKIYKKKRINKIKKKDKIYCQFIKHKLFSSPTDLYHMFPRCLLSVVNFISHNHCEIYIKR